MYRLNRVSRMINNIESINIDTVCVSTIDKKNCINLIIIRKKSIFIFFVFCLLTKPLCKYIFSNVVYSIFKTEYIFLAEMDPIYANKKPVNLLLSDVNKKLP